MYSLSALLSIVYHYFAIFSLCELLFLRVCQFFFATSVSVSPEHFLPHDSVVAKDQDLLMCCLSVARFYLFLSVFCGSSIVYIHSFSVLSVTDEYVPEEDQEQCQQEKGREVF